jgi:uncharacterized membrane protein
MSAAKPGHRTVPRIPHRDHDEPTIYAARLEPYRSLGPRGFMIVMVVIAAISFVCGMAFLLMGAWPVFGLFGLDVLVLYWAFRMNFRQARAHEEISITPSLITVRKVDPAGHAQVARMNTLWTRLDAESIEDFGVQKLTLRSRGDGIEVGSFLHTAQREELAEELSLALSTAKRGVVRSSF